MVYISCANLWPLLLKRVNSLLGKSVWIFTLSRMFAFYTCLYMYASWKVFVVYPFVSKITAVIKFSPLCPELYPHIDANLLSTISSFMYQFLLDLMWVLPSFSKNFQNFLAHNSVLFVLRVEKCVCAAMYCSQFM